MLAGRPRGFFILHETRQAASTRMADARADLFTLAAIFGHRDIRMTARHSITRILQAGMHQRRTQPQALSTFPPLGLLLQPPHACPVPITKYEVWQCSGNGSGNGSKNGEAVPRLLALT